MKSKLDRASSFAVLGASDAANYVIEGDELIVFSPLRKGYFGITGAGKSVFETVINSGGETSEEAIVTSIAAGRSLSSTDIALIHAGIQTLLDLGALYER